MKKLNLIVTIFVLFFATDSAMGMKRSFTTADTKIENQSKELFTEFRNLPPELQQHILLLKDDIIFLSEQPITLAGPNGHTQEIYSVAIDENNESITTSESDESSTDASDTVVTAGKDNMVKVWNINTGNFLHECANTDKNYYTKHLIPCYYDIPISNGTFTYGINTGELIRKVKENNMRIIWKLSPILIDDKLIMGSDANTVKIFELSDDIGLKDLFTLTGPNQHMTKVCSIDINDNIIITGSWDWTAKIWDMHTGEFLRTLAGPYKHISWVRAVKINGNVAITGSSDKTAKIWDVASGVCLRTLAGPNGHTGEITSVALNDNYVITGSEDCTTKIWPLLPNLKGTPETNPLLWIIHNTNPLQLNLIQRAYKKTVARKNFIIALPKKLNMKEDDESQKQMDGRIYFTLIPTVREYLRTRLNIRKQCKFY